MRYYVISALVLVPLLMLLSMIVPLVVKPAEKPIGPEATIIQSSAGDPTRGETLYRSKCYGCHTPQANLGPDFASADFKTRYADDAALIAILRAGRAPMPAFTEQMLDEQDLADIIAYLRTLP